MGRNLKAYGDWVVLQPGDNVYRGSIAVPDSFKNKVSNCLVMSAGKGVKGFREGDTVLVQGHFADRQNKKIEGHDAFFCKKEEVFAKIHNGKIFPIGARILLLRNNRQFQDKESNLYIPSKALHQSLSGIIVGLGVETRYKNEKGKYTDTAIWRNNGYKIGSSVLLSDWGEHMIEIQYRGKYHLIVNESDMIAVLEDHDLESESTFKYRNAIHST